MLCPIRRFKDVTPFILTFSSHLLFSISGSPCYNNADEFITDSWLSIETSEKLNDADHAVTVTGKRVKITVKPLLPLLEVGGRFYPDNR